MAEITQKAADAIIAALRRHCSPYQLRSVLKTLADTPGNRAFRDGIENVLLSARAPARTSERDDPYREAPDFEHE